MLEEAYRRAPAWDPLVRAAVCCRVASIESYIVPSMKCKQFTEPSATTLRSSRTCCIYIYIICYINFKMISPSSIEEST
jgi:hypothetical protein